MEKKEIVFCIALLLAGVMLGRSTPISNVARNNVVMEIPRNSNNFQEFSKISNNFQEKIDINTATFFKLKSLKGVGENKARQIIRGRPYKTTEEIFAKGMIGEKTYKNIENCIKAGG